MKVFRKVYVEITNRCNLSCAFCRPTSRPAADMSREAVERILSQLRGRCRLLHLHVLGEPLLHPDLGWILRHCAASGLRVNLVTNGTLLRQRAEDILDQPALRQISVSLHSLSRDIGQDGLAAYFAGLSDFVRLARGRMGFNLRLRLWRSDAEADHGLRQRILERIETLCALPYALREALEGRSCLQLQDRISLHLAASFEWPDRQNPDYGAEGGCLGLRDQLAVLVDGSVVPCCLDRDGLMRLGNLNSATLESILRSDRASRIRAGFGQGLAVEQLCRRCLFRLRFARQNGL